jgi:hypothetical protein
LNESVESITGRIAGGGGRAETPASREQAGPAPKCGRLASRHPSVFADFDPTGGRASVLAIGENPAKLLEKRTRLRPTSVFATLRRDKSARQEAEINNSRNSRNLRINKSGTSPLIRFSNCRRSPTRITMA